MFKNNFTIRDLMNTAMPLTSLSEQEWLILNDFIERLELKKESSDICLILKKLQSNQARIEVMGSMSLYYEAEEPVKDSSVAVCF